jgi:gas vesicle protein
MNVASLRKSHVNFRVIEEIKNVFEDNCRYNGSTMTYELTQFMKAYINEQSNFLNTISNLTTPKHTTVKKHIKPAQKSKEDDWYDEAPPTSTNSIERHGDVVKNEYGVWEPIR